MAKRVYPKVDPSDLDRGIMYCRNDSISRVVLIEYLEEIGVPSANKYSVQQLKDRIKTIIRANRQGKAVDFTTDSLQKKVKDYNELQTALKKIAAEKTANDPVNHPSHYTTGKIEVIDFIEDKELDFCLGNAVKYIARAGKKDPKKEKEDLQKAIWYINRKIKRL